MEVRRARPGDEDGFAAVVADVAAEGDWLATEPPVDTGAFAARVRSTMDAGQEALWVLADGGRVVGTMGVHAGSAPGVRSLGMAIAADGRGRGHGRAMVQAALAHAWADGAHKVELEVFTRNARAIGLYASCGFVVEGVRRAHRRRRDGTLRDVMLMAAAAPGDPGQREAAG